MLCYHNGDANSNSLQLNIIELIQNRKNTDVSKIAQTSFRNTFSIFRKIQNAYNHNSNDKIIPRHDLK